MNTYIDQDKKNIHITIFDEQEVIDKHFKFLDTYCFERWTMTIQCDSGNYVCDKQVNVVDMEVLNLEGMVICKLPFQSKVINMKFCKLKHDQPLEFLGTAELHIQDCQLEEVCQIKGRVDDLHIHKISSGQLDLSKCKVNNLHIHGDQNVIGISSTTVVIRM